MPISEKQKIIEHIFSLVEELLPLTETITSDHFTDQERRRVNEMTDREQTFVPNLSERIAKLLEITRVPDKKIKKYISNQNTAIESIKSKNELIYRTVDIIKVLMPLINIAISDQFSDGDRIKLKMACSKSDRMLKLFINLSQMHSRLTRSLIRDQPIEDPAPDEIRYSNEKMPLYSERYRRHSKFSHYGYKRSSC
jgi:hypothetical protein